MGEKDWFPIAGLLVLLLILLGGVVSGPAEEAPPLPPLSGEIFLGSMEALCPDDTEMPGAGPSPCLKGSPFAPPVTVRLNTPAPARDSNGRTLPGAGYIRWVYNLFRQNTAAG